MSNFMVPQRELQINLEGDFGGAELTCKLDVSIGTFVELQKLSANEGTVIDSYKKFGDEILISWNFTDAQGKPLPPNGEGMLALSPALAIGILGAWTSQVSGNPIDSSNELLDGSTLAEESTKTEKK
jgi:hypothetical protein